MVSCFNFNCFIHHSQVHLSSKLVLRLSFKNPNIDRITHDDINAILNDYYHSIPPLDTLVGLFNHLVEDYYSHFTHIAKID